jgi:hypothetical protein
MLEDWRMEAASWGGTAVARAGEAAGARMVAVRAGEAAGVRTATGGEENVVGVTTVGRI